MYLELSAKKLISIAGECWRCSGVEVPIIFCSEGNEVVLSLLCRCCLRNECRLALAFLRKASEHELSRNSSGRFGVRQPIPKV